VVHSPCGTVDCANELPTEAGKVARRAVANANASVILLNIVMLLVSLVLASKPEWDFDDGTAVT
jgi:hypothetical protein